MNAQSLPVLVTQLTPREKEIAALVGHGYSCARIGSLLGLRPGAVRVVVMRIADKLTNPDEIKPFPLVMLWAVHQSRGVAMK